MNHLFNLKQPSLYLVLGLFLSSALMGQNDVVTMENGDVLVGEIKSIGNGILMFDASYADSDFAIDWDEVAKVRSDRSFLVLLTKGGQYSGSFTMDSSKSGHILVHDIDEGEISVNLDDIMQVIPFRRKFWSRFDAGFDLGYTFTKASSNSQFNLSAYIGYLAEKDEVDVYFSSVLNSQKVTDASGVDTTNATRRINYGLTYRRFLFSSWFVYGSADFLTNEEQKLDLRSNVGVGLGTKLVSTRSLFLSTDLGLSWLNERFQGSDTVLNNAELGLGLAFVVFNAENITINTGVKGYWVMTQTDRYRVDFKGFVKWDLPLDFYIKLEYNHNFDSAPPSPDASRNDFVLVTAFGWEL